MHKEHLTFVESATNLPPESHGNEGTRIFRVLHMPSVDERLRIGLPAFLAAAKAARAHGLCAGLLDRRGLLVSTSVVSFGEHPVLTLLVGRHSHADLRAEGPDLALRHVSLVCTKSDASRVRVFDLRSEATAQRRTGEAIDVALAGLPTVFQLGSYLLVVAATPGVDDPLSSGFGHCAPLADDTPGTPFLFRMESFESRPARSPLSFSAAPVAHDFDLMGREPTGEVTCVFAPDPALTEHWFRPCLSDLARGVLIGRYERCDAPSDGMRWNQTLSRVHALLFLTGNAAYICDAASTFGVEHETLGKTRLKHLQAGDVFWLGSCRLTVVEALS